MSWVVAAAVAGVSTVALAVAYPAIPRTRTAITGSGVMARRRGARIAGRVARFAGWVTGIARRVTRIARRVARAFLGMGHRRGAGIAGSRNGLVGIGAENQRGAAGRHYNSLIWTHPHRGAIAG